MQLIVSMYISYSIVFAIVSEICIDGCFLEDCFYCYSRHMISSVANESQIPYNIMKRAPETQNL